MDGQWGVGAEAGSHFVCCFVNGLTHVHLKTQSKTCLWRDVQSRSLKCHFDRLCG